VERFHGPNLQGKDFGLNGMKFGAENGRNLNFDNFDIQNHQILQGKVVLKCVTLWLCQNSY
jgi:hypothetical protein